MLVNYTSKSEIIHAFTNEFRHHNLPMFGGQAGRNIRELNTSLVYGRKCYTNGIVAIVFIGDELKPNDYFVRNVCEFPLIFHRNNALVARVASGYDSVFY